MQPSSFEQTIDSPRTHVDKASGLVRGQHPDGLFVAEPAFCVVLYIRLGPEHRAGFRVYLYLGSSTDLHVSLASDCLTGAKNLLKTLRYTLIICASRKSIW